MAEGGRRGGKNIEIDPEYRLGMTTDSTFHKNKITKRNSVFLGNKELVVETKKRTDFSLRLKERR